MKAVAKEIAQASEMTQVSVALASMWALCALLLILK